MHHLSVKLSVFSLALDSEQLKGVVDKSPEIRGAVVPELARLDIDG